MNDKRRGREPEGRRDSCPASVCLLLAVVTLVAVALAAVSGPDVLTGEEAAALGELFIATEGDKGGGRARVS